MVKRFTETVSTGDVRDNLTGKEYRCEYRIDEEFLELVNDIAEESKQLKQFKEQNIQEYLKLKNICNNCKKENKQLKSAIKKVIELLEEEVDLFSDKAIEHDINAYMELREFDNKDAYYMAISTKKAIKMLKGVDGNETSYC